MKSILRGIFLTSEDPSATAAFYRDVAGLDWEEVGTGSGYVYWKLDRDGVQLALHDAKLFANYTHPARRESNLTHLYFQIPDQKAFLEKLLVMNVPVDSQDEVVVTVVDPDGRRVMFGTA